MMLRYLVVKAGPEITQSIDRVHFFCRPGGQSEPVHLSALPLSTCLATDNMSCVTFHLVTRYLHVYLCSKTQNHKNKEVKTKKAEPDLTFFWPQPTASMQMLLK